MTPRRLTEEEFTELMRVVVGDAHVAPIHWVWVSRAIDELRALRLSDVDRDLVAWMRGQMRATIFQDKGVSARLAARALALLDRLAGLK